MTRLALNTAAALATLAALAILWQFRGVALLFLLALAVAAAIRPPIELLVDRGCPTALAVGLVYAPLLVLLTAMLWIPAERLRREFQQAGDDAVRVGEKIKSWRDGNWLQREVVRALPAADPTAPAPSGARVLAFAQSVLGLTFSAAAILFQALLVLVISLYWSIDRARLQRLLLSLVPAKSRPRARELWHALQREVGSYLRSEFVQCLLAVVALAFGYSAIGHPYPVLMAFVGALAWLIPWVGAIFAIGALTLASVPAMLTGPTWHAVLVLSASVVYTCLILLLLEIAVEPRLFNRQRYSMVLIALVAISLSTVWGVFGLLLGPPLAIAIQVAAGELLRGRTDSGDEPGGRRLPDLVERLAALRGSLAAGEPKSPGLANMIDRLSGILARAERQLHRSDAEDRLLAALAPATAEMMTVPLFVENAPNHSQ